MSIFVSTGVSSLHKLEREGHESHELPFDEEEAGADGERVAELMYKRFRGKIHALSKKYENMEKPTTSSLYRLILRSESKSHALVNSTIRARLFGTHYLSEELSFLQADLRREDSYEIPGLENDLKSKVSSFIYEVELPNLGNLLALAIGHDADVDPSWFLTSVVIIAEPLSTSSASTSPPSTPSEPPHSLSASSSAVPTLPSPPTHGADVFGRWECPVLQWYSKVKGDRALYRIHYAHPIGDVVGSEEAIHVRSGETREAKDPETNTTFIEYELACESGSMCWSVWVRYSDLWEVTNRLKKKVPEIVQFNRSFPERKFFKSSSATDTQEERKSGFQQWFREVMQIPEVAQSREMRALLQCPPNSLRTHSPTAHASSMSSPALTTTAAWQKTSLTASGGSHHFIGRREVSSSSPPPQ